MKTPIKIIETQVKNDLVELRFAFPWEEKIIFKDQIANFWKIFNAKNANIEMKFISLTQHIQSAKASVAKLLPYTREKHKLIQELSNEINGFISLHEHNKASSLVELPKNLRFDVESALRKYTENSRQLKDAYKYEHVYLKEMVESFSTIKEIAASIFQRYENMMDKLQTLDKTYSATVRLSYATKLRIEDFSLKGHKDLSEIKFQSDVITFIKNCVQKIIHEEFSELDTRAQRDLNSFILDDFFISNFKDQVIDVESYISEYQTIVKTQQELLDLSDYKGHFYSRGIFFEEKNKMIEKNLKSLWMEFSQTYDALVDGVRRNPVVLNKLKKQIFKLSLRDFFALDQHKVFQQALTDVSVDDFSESYSFVTWKTIQKENNAFVNSFKNNFFNKYANKYSCVEVKSGVFFSEENEEFKLVFIVMDQESSPELDMFIKRLENKYQKQWGNVKSIKSQKLSDVLTLHYKDSKITVPMNYFFFTFKDPGLLQGIKSLSLS